MRRPTGRRPARRALGRCSGRGSGLAQVDRAGGGPEAFFLCPNGSSAITATTTAPTSSPTRPRPRCSPATEHCPDDLRCHGRRSSVVHRGCRARAADVVRPDGAGCGRRPSIAAACLRPRSPRAPRHRHGRAPPRSWAAAEAAPNRGHSDHLHDQADDAVHQTRCAATTTRIRARETRAGPPTSLSAITMILLDRMSRSGSLRMTTALAPPGPDHRRLAVGIVSAQRGPDLLRTLVEVRRTDHQQRRDQPGKELAQQQGTPGR